MRIPFGEVFIRWSGPSAAREWTLGPKSWVHAQSKEPSSPRRGNPFPPSFDDTERHPGSSAKPSCRIRPFGEQTTGAIRPILRQGGGPRIRLYCPLNYNTTQDDLGVKMRVKFGAIISILAFLVVFFYVLIVYFTYPAG